MKRKKTILEKKENIPKQWQLYGFGISDKYIALKYLTNIIYDLGKKKWRSKNAANDLDEDYLPSSQIGPCHPSMHVQE